MNAAKREILPVCFVIAAAVLNIIYLCHFTPLLKSYPHGAQRFFHVVHLAEAALGQPGRVPVSMLTLLSEMAPNQLDEVSAIPCGEWESGVREAYCHRRLGRRQPVSFGSLLAIPLAPQRTFAFTPHAAAAHFPMIGYLFYGLGAWLALLLRLPPVLVLYSAAVCNAAATIALGYYTLRLLPILRWPVAYLLLTPTLLMNRTVIMPDALAVDICFLALAVSLALRVQPRRLNAWHAAGLIALSIAIGLIKVAYFLVPAVFLLIPLQCFARKLSKITVAALAIACAALASLGWGLYVAQHYGLEDRLSTAPGGIISPLLVHPFAYAGDIVATFFHHGVLPIKLDNILTWNLCWIHSLPLDLFLFSPLALLTVLPPASERAPAVRLHWPERLLALAIAAGSAIVLFVVMLFNMKSPLGLTGVQFALQGRYFIPVIPFLLLALYDLIPLQTWNIRHILPAFAAGCLIGLHYGQLIQPLGVYARCSVLMPGYWESQASTP